ncbi:hypothetical protein Syun_001496 [Stephania yunnanensis]|uniref:Uncharacterized protein n=1 Tax=Stephania yunnanensis TaxID=152371 RepID=A0AAP0LE12_9MAGN
MSKGKGKEATLDRSVDEEQLYYDVTGDWPKGRVYGLRSLGSRKRGYGNPCASTMVRHTQFDVVVQMLARFAAFSAKVLLRNANGLQNEHFSGTTTTTTTTT